MVVMAGWWWWWGGGKHCTRNTVNKEVWLRSDPRPANIALGQHHSQQDCKDGTCEGGWYEDLNRGAGLFWKSLSEKVVETAEVDERDALNYSKVRSWEWEEAKDRETLDLLDRRVSAGPSSQRSDQRHQCCWTVTCHLYLLFLFTCVDSRRAHVRTFPCSVTGDLIGGFSVMDASSLRQVLGVVGSGCSVDCAGFRRLVLFPSHMYINKDCKKKRNILSFF